MHTPAANPFIPLPAVSLGELITVRRRELGHSQRELADLICAAAGRTTVTRHEISRYERETRIPTGTSLATLAAVLRLPTPHLRRAALFAINRRRLSIDERGHVIDSRPAYLIGANYGGEPQPMLLIGVEDV